ncbi:DEAD/DEAH box helicase [Paenibacillus marinisediminis]
MEAIPAALNGSDVIAQSQTGTGKTFAYLLPVLSRMDWDQRTPQVVIVAPTQELAMQIVREAEALGSELGLVTAPLIGGAALNRQLDKLKQRPQLIVGTPGRIREIIEMKKLKMHEVRTIVIDEVDHVLQKSGARDTETILNRAQRSRQLLFFSATLPQEVKALAAKWMNEPVQIGIEPDKRVADTIEHLMFVVEEREKIDMLRRLVRLWEPKRAIVFVNDSQQIGEWEAKLKYAHMSVGSLYGDAPKQERVNVLRRFRDGEFQLLLATDVAARGLDIPELPYVFSLQPALDAEHYVHRAGRTGRMGRKGVSVNLITERERFIMRKFERALNITIAEKVYSGGKLIKPEDKNTAKQRMRPQAAQTPARDKSGERHRERKNKGAPKWLKSKQSDSMKRS